MASVFHGGATKKCKTNDHHQLHRTSHKNFVKLWRTIENTTWLQSDPAGQVINISKNDTQKKFSDW